MVFLSYSDKGERSLNLKTGCFGRLTKQIYHEQLPATNLILSPKKWIVSFEYLALNLIVRWELFNVLIIFQGFFSMSPNKKMYMCLHHIIGFSSNVLMIFSSKSVINKIAYWSAIFVPIAVPHTSLRVFSSNLKNVFLALFQAITWDLFVILQFQKSAKRSRTITMWNVRVKTNNVNSTQNRSVQ